MDDSTSGQFQFIDCSSITTENKPQGTDSDDGTFQPNEINPLEFVTKEEVKELYVLKVEDFKVENMEDQSSSTLQPHSITKSEFEAIKEEVLEPTDHVECDSFGLDALQSTGLGNDQTDSTFHLLEFITKEEIKEQYILKVEDFREDNREAEADFCAEDPISDPLRMSPKPEYKTELLKTDPEEHETPQDEYSVKDYQTVEETHPKRQYQCETCNKSFGRKWHLIKHQATVHSGLKPFLCNTCNKSFGEKCNLTKHEATVHSGLKPFVCNTCNKSFGEKCNLTKHEATVHYRLKPFLCNTCNKSFGQKSDLTKHQATVHSGLKPFVCNTCNKSFGQKGNLITHQATVHSGLNPFVCNTCNKSFGQKSNLTKHRATVHSGLKPFVCNTCNKSFGQKGNLITHQATVHSGLKPYVCNTCNKSFGYKIGLIKHLDTVHSGLGS